jgi:hypothetical protein
MEPSAGFHPTLRSRLRVQDALQNSGSHSLLSSAFATKPYLPFACVLLFKAKKWRHPDKQSSADTDKTPNRFQRSELPGAKQVRKHVSVDTCQCRYNFATRSGGREAEQIGLILAIDAQPHQGGRNQ